MCDQQASERDLAPFFGVASRVASRVDEASAFLCRLQKTKTKTSWMSAQKPHRNLLWKCKNTHCNNSHENTCMCQSISGMNLAQKSETCSVLQQNFRQFTRITTCKSRYIYILESTLTLSSHYTKISCFRLEQEIAMKLKRPVALTRLSLETLLSHMLSGRKIAKRSSFLSLPTYAFWIRLVYQRITLSAFFPRNVFHKETGKIAAIRGIVQQPFSFNSRNGGMLLKELAVVTSFSQKCLNFHLGTPVAETAAILFYLPLSGNFGTKVPCLFLRENCLKITHHNMFIETTWTI